MLGWEHYLYSIPRIANAHMLIVNIYVKDWELI